MGAGQAERLQLPSVQHTAHVPVQGQGEVVEVGSGNSPFVDSQLFGGQFTHFPACTCQLSRLGFCPHSWHVPGTSWRKGTPGSLLEALIRENSP